MLCLSLYPATMCGNVFQIFVYFLAEPRKFIRNNSNFLKLLTNASLSNERYISGGLITEAVENDNRNDNYTNYDSNYGKNYDNKINFYTKKTLSVLPVLLSTRPL